MPMIEFLGESPQAVRVREDAMAAARRQCAVLITGESGSGKQVVARLIHTGSRRAAREFIQVNCAALPVDLVESELFGFEKGAFTGAVRRKLGLVKAADGGSLFFDEFPEIPLAIQAKLLKFLDGEGFYNLGGTNSRAVDVRVVSATNQDVAAAVRQGRLKADLLYRLRVLSIHIPPLRDRRDDIPLFVRHYLREIALREGQAGKGFSGEAVRALLDYRWPGNVRELSSTVYQAVVNAGSRPIIELSDLPLFILSAVSASSGQYFSSPPDFGREPSIEEIEGWYAGYVRDYLLYLRCKYGNTYTQMARALQTDRARARYLLKKHGITRDNEDPQACLGVFIAFSRPPNAQPPLIRGGC